MEGTTTTLRPKFELLRLAQELVEYDKVVQLETDKLKATMIQGDMAANDEVDDELTPTKKTKTSDDAISVSAPFYPQAIAAKEPVLVPESTGTSGTEPESGMMEKDNKALQYEKLVFDDPELDWVNEVDWKEQDRMWEACGNPAGRASSFVNNPLPAMFANMQTMSNCTITIHMGSLKA